MDQTASTNIRKYETNNPFKKMAMKRFFKALLSLPFEADTVLDAGCGEGFAANRLLEARPELTILGVDTSRAALLAAQEISAEMDAILADVTRLPFLPDQFDLVVSLEVLEHLPYPERAIANYKKLSSRYLLLSVPNEPIFRTLRVLEGNDILEWGDHPEHVNHWNFLSFTRFLEKHGLRVVARKVPFPFAWVIVLCEVIG